MNWDGEERQKQRDDQAYSLWVVFALRYQCNLLNLCFFFFSFLLKNVIDRKPYPDDENLVEVKFARTPVMSTYLVAFVVGEYDFVETRSKDGVCVRVYTPVGKAEQGKFALEVNVLEEDCSNSP